MSDHDPYPTWTSDGDALLVRIGSSGPDSSSSGSRGDRGPDPRTRRTRAAIVDAATTLFLRNGYQGTSTEDIAALAGVSKRTVYNNFSDKERLFTEIILGSTVLAEQLADGLAATLADARDVPAALHAAARRHIRAVMRPQVLQLRRLLIAEAPKFPELAREYHRRAPGRVLASLASALGTLAERGLLQVSDPARAAEHFAFLIVGALLDRAMFGAGGNSGERDDDRTDGATDKISELDRIADDGVRVFLSAYGPGAA